MYKIAVYRNGVVQQVLSLEADQYYIGRAPSNAIVLDQLEVSGQHAKIVRDGDAYYVVDEASRNGVFVNGGLVKRYRLKEGSEIVIGNFVLKCTSSTIPPGDQQRPATPTPAAGNDPMARTRMGDLAKLNSTLEMHKRTAYLRSASQTLGENNPRLVTTDQKLQAVTYPLRDTALTIGSGKSCTIATRGWFTPSLAASVEWYAGAVVLVRRSTFSRIFWNGTPTKKIQILADGDTLKISGVELKFFV